MRALRQLLQALIILLYGVALSIFYTHSPVDPAIILSVSVFFVFLFSLTLILREYTENRMNNKRVGLSRYKTTFTNYIFPTTGILIGLVTAALSVKYTYLISTNTNLSGIEDIFKTSLRIGPLLFFPALGSGVSFLLLKLSNQTNPFNIKVLAYARKISMAMYGVFVIPFLILGILPNLILAIAWLAVLAFGTVILAPIAVLEFLS